MKKTFAFTLLFALSACSDDSNPTGPDEVAAAMQASIATDLADLVQAAKDLQTAAPTPAGRGWDATMDATAITNMKTAWKRTRVAYEHVEGALAPIFSDLDFTMDARYDDYLTAQHGEVDTDAFDDEGETGMHSIERILYADLIPARVVTFESDLPGYAPAAFPATAAEAVDFKTKLVQKLIDDATSLQSQWVPAKVDIAAAYAGLIDLMNEQHEKVTKAATGEEESRYSQLTLFDLRNNLDGTRKIYLLFQPWIKSESGGPPVDTKIIAGMDHLKSVYDSFPGDNVPAPPDDWQAAAPTAANLATQFGMIYTEVNTAVNKDDPNSIVGQMTAAALVVGLSLQ